VGLESNRDELIGTVRGVDLEAGPAFAIVVDELRNYDIIDADDERDRSVVSIAFDLIVDAPMYDESLPERHPLEDRPDCLLASGMLPDAAPWTKLEICQDGRANPEPGSLRVAHESFCWPHGASFEASRVGACPCPLAGFGLTISDDVDPCAPHFLDEIIKHARAVERPHANPHSTELAFELWLICSTRGASDSELPNSVEAALVGRGSGPKRQEVSKSIPYNRVDPGRSGYDPVAGLESLANERGRELP